MFALFYSVYHPNPKQHSHFSQRLVFLEKSMEKKIPTADKKEKKSKTTEDASERVDNVNIIWSILRLYKKDPKFALAVRICIIPV